MAIDVVWQDERGVEQARYAGPSITTALVACAKIDSKCLQFIDPYGDTTFNAKQVTALESELGQLLEDGIDSSTTNQATLLLEFVKQVQKRTHLYLKFIGD